MKLPDILIGLCASTVSVTISNRVKFPHRDLYQSQIETARFSANLKTRQVNDGCY